MNSAEYVANNVEELKKTGNPLQWVAWQVALLCVAWAYVFGARGEYCSPVNRRAYYGSKGDAHPTIKTACKNFDGTGSCSGCKWYPGDKRTRFFDCRGFTYWVLLQVFGWKLMGTGATKQWETVSNWKAKGSIDTMPKDTLVCLFVAKGATMSHTGFGYNNETVECSNGVQHSKTRSSKWTHWGVPACIEGTVPEPTPEPAPAKKPTLRRGSKGASVKELQEALIAHGYNLDPYGADGDFGKVTEAAVKAFQKANGLSADGVVGEKTWAALAVPVNTSLYTVTIPHLSKSQADALCSQYPGTTYKQEGGE